MKDIPLRSYVYFALCELCDAYDNLDCLSSRLEDDSVKSLIDNISNDVDNVISKLQKISL